MDLVVGISGDETLQGSRIRVIIPSLPARNDAPEGREGGRRPCRTCQTDHLSYPSAFFSYPSSGGRVRHSDYTGAVGAQGRHYDDDLNARPQPRREICAESPQLSEVRIFGQQKADRKAAFAA